MEVAQPSLAVLDVGLDLVAAFAGPAGTLVALGHLGIDELPCGAGDDLGPKAVLELREELPVAEDEPRIEKRGPDRNVGKSELQALIDRPGGVAHFEAQVPKDVKHVFGDAFPPWRLLVGEQEE